jgi:signal transduction histidine kinase
VSSPLERALARERERTRALREVGLLLDSTVPLDELLRRVLAAAARVTEAERATLYLVDEGGHTLSSYATEGGGTERIVLKLGEGIAGAAAQDRRTVSAPDAYGDPRFERTWDQRTGYRTRSVLASPMLTRDGRVVGVLQVLNRRDQGTFDADDVAMLEALAAQAATAIEGARQLLAMTERNRALTELRERLERSLRERNLLLEMEQLLSRTDSLDEFLQGALAGVMRETGAEAGCVLLADEATGTLSFRAVRGVAGEAALQGTAPVGPSLAVESARRGESFLRAEVTGAEASILPGDPPRSLLVVPLPGEHGPLGVIELRDRREGTFGAVDLDLLTLVAANVSTGVELAHARRERERATRLAAVGRTLSNVLHDIRTPMTIISGYAQLMAGIDDAGERARYAESIVRQFDHVQAMIGELLAFVRGETQLLAHKVFVEPFFRETVEVLRRELASRGVTVSLEVRERGAARLDTAKITRLVHNLARNAADALAPRGGGTFRILVDRADNDLVLTFEDDGPGIPESIRPQLFESFVTEGKPGGTGLGLAIVKKVVDEHHGVVAVETGAWGTRFTIRLPLQGPPPSTHPPPR